MKEQNVDYIVENGALSGAQSLDFLRAIFKLNVFLCDQTKAKTTTQTHSHP